MTDIGCLYLDRDNPRQAMRTIAEGTRRLEEGLSLGLFPEGTRNHGKELLPFKEGGYRMAEKSGRPIVLMALTGIDDIFENNHHMLKKKHVVIEYSEPFYPSKMEKAERKEFYVSIPGRIEEMLANAGKDGK
jgi:1-acyl-sn-glycerol-3-phosphate acyltransferase